jgi:hypothetical protein
MLVKYIDIQTLSSWMRTRVDKVITLFTELFGNFLRASPDLISTPQRLRTIWDLIVRLQILGTKNKIKLYLIDVGV